MKLHGALNSPYVRMCMVTALEAGLGLRVQLVKADLTFVKADSNLERLSALGKVPVLETDHGHPLHDSRVIMEYLCHSAGNKALLPDDGVKRFRILTLLALAQGLCDAAVALRVETANRPKGLQWPELEARLKQRMTATLAELETHWQKDLQDVNLASIGVACALAYIEYRHTWFDWRKDYSSLAHFQNGFNTRDSMVNAALPPA
jgi:glutathione S-transferase